MSNLALAREYAAELEAKLKSACDDCERLEGINDVLLEALKKATHELNAIRARDGAPQHIHWDRGRPLQTDSCTHEYWDALTEECFAAIRKATGAA